MDLVVGVAHRGAPPPLFAACAALLHTLPPRGPSSSSSARTHARPAAAGCCWFAAADHPSLAIAPHTHTQLTLRGTRTPSTRTTTTTTAAALVAGLLSCFALRAHAVSIRCRTLGSLVYVVLWVRCARIGRCPCANDCGPRIDVVTSAPSQTPHLSSTYPSSNHHHHLNNNAILH